MQVKFGEFNAVQNETIQISPEQIAGYILLRSRVDKFKFNCYAVDKEDVILFCAASGLDFEKASAWVEAINKEFYPVVESPTETVFVEIGVISPEQSSYSTV